jgi:hypothetical protein
MMTAKKFRLSAQRIRHAEARSCHARPQYLIIAAAAIDAQLGIEHTATEVASYLPGSIKLTA